MLQKKDSIKISENSYYYEKTIHFFPCGLSRISL